MFIDFISIQGLITYIRGFNVETRSLITPQQVLSPFVCDFQVLGAKN
jgi:hypothetical protein